MSENKIKQYTIPSTVEEANVWLKHGGIKHLKFSKYQGKIAVKLAQTEKIIAIGDSVEELCLGLMFNRLENKSEKDISKRKWTQELWGIPH